MDLIKLHDFMEIALPLSFFLGNLQSFRRSNFCSNTSNWLLVEKKNVEELVFGKASENILQLSGEANNIL